jgi:hypothetical protein
MRGSTSFSGLDSDVEDLVGKRRWTGLSGCVVPNFESRFGFGEITSRSHQTSGVLI